MNAGWGNSVLRTVKLALVMLVLSMSRPALSRPILDITIARTSENASSTTGELFVDGRFVAHTLELPWRNNQSYISSIPVGSYTAHLRFDKSDGWRLQLDDVPGRSGVQLHIGNYPNQIEGCVLVGLAVNNAESRVELSAEAYDRLRAAFYGSVNARISPDKQVRVTIKYYPRATELRASQGARWVYDGSGKWYYGSERLLQSEYWRDMNWIYLKYNGPNFFIRFPIHGGRLSQFASRRDGPWSDGESTITREF